MVKMTNSEKAKKQKTSERGACAPNSVKKNREGGSCPRARPCSQKSKKRDTLRQPKAKESHELVQKVTRGVKRVVQVRPL